MFPFMKGTKHHEVGEQTMSEFAPIVEDGDLGLALHSTADVKPGMYLWMKPRAGQPGFLSLLTDTDARSDLIEVQLLNSSTKTRVDGWQAVWYDDHEDKSKRCPRPYAKTDEYFEYRTPVSNTHSKRYKPWTETATFSDFVPIALDPTSSKSGYLRLSTKFHARHVLGDGRRRARETGWYVDHDGARNALDHESDSDRAADRDGNGDRGGNSGGADSPTALYGQPNASIDPERSSDGGRADRNGGGNRASGLRRSTRRTRNRTPAYTGELIDHGTKQAVVQWIRSRPEPALDLPRLAGSGLIEVSESNPLLLGSSAGNCKGLHAHGVRGSTSTTKSVGAPAVGIRGGHVQGADLAPRPHRLTHLRQVAGGL